MLFWCGVATVCDAVCTTAVYIAGARIVGCWNWTSRLKLAAADSDRRGGGNWAVLVERIALQTGMWRYSPSMPVIPVVGVGLWPFLQLPVLTVLVFAIVGRIGRVVGRVPGSGEST